MLFNEDTLSHVNKHTRTHMHMLTLAHNLVSFTITIVLVCVFLNYSKLFLFFVDFKRLASTITMATEWSFLSNEEQGGHVIKYRVVHSSTDQPITFKEVLNLLYGSVSFRELFIKELRDVPFEAYFFETPPTNGNTLAHLHFEFVLVNAHTLAQAQPDTRAFKEHFAPGCVCATFENLGGDATLVSPCPLSDTEVQHYTHLGSFMRNADHSQVHELWRTVAITMVKHVVGSKQEDDRKTGHGDIKGEVGMNNVGDQGDWDKTHGISRRTWLSTSGLGVGWLHVRLDSRPKYYTYEPYKS